MITARFSLSTGFKDYIHTLTPKFGFGLLGESIYYRTYSRIKPDGTNESWHDTVLRVIEGVFSVRKDVALKSGYTFDDDAHQELAEEMALSMFNMEWLPAGRGLWAMGTDFMYQRGGAALFNCGLTSFADLPYGVHWLMDMLMHGVGVGIHLNWAGKVNPIPNYSKFEYSVEDTRESWAESVRLLVAHFVTGTPLPVFKYHKIREKGADIHGFGGTASGPKALEDLHTRITQYFEMFFSQQIGPIELQANIANAVGCCVILGNARRGAEIIGVDVSKTDQFLEFINLKKYDKKPYRSDIGWMSNNSAMFNTVEDFDLIPLMCEYCRSDGDPGFVNVMNSKRLGRIGEHMFENGSFYNPCGEMFLKYFELCNLVDVFWHRIKDHARFYQAIKYAAFYATTVSMVDTHNALTNAVMQENLRIGVSLPGLFSMRQDLGYSDFVTTLRSGYDCVTYWAREFNAELGRRPPIKHTALKPGGTTAPMAGVIGGLGIGPFKHGVRRVLFGASSRITAKLKAAGVKNCLHTNDQGTVVFDFPLDLTTTPTEDEVSALDQFEMLQCCQTHWADNSCSATVYLSEDEQQHLDSYIMAFLPNLKAVSTLPRLRPVTPTKLDRVLERFGVHHGKTAMYKHLPFEPLDDATYKQLVSQTPTSVDWFGLRSDGVSVKFCDGDKCEVQR